MSTDTAVTVLTWVLAGVAAATLVGVVLVRRWAGRVLVVAVAAIVLIIGLFARADLSGLAVDNPEALCRGGVSWFGLQLSGSETVCANYR